jgi:hypothetical protein
MKYIGTGPDINIFFVQIISHSRMYIPQQEGMSQKKYSDQQYYYTEKRKKPY